MTPFEIVEPGHLQPMEPLPEGMVSIAKSGRLTIRQADLEAAGIEHYVIALADRETFRLGLRAVHDDERMRSVAVSVVTAGKAKRDTSRRSINVARAIRRLGLEPAALAGRYELHPKDVGHETILVLHLMPETVGIGKTPVGGKKEKK